MPLKKNGVLFHSFLVTKGGNERPIMTIGIGLLCERGKCILMGADMRGSYEAIATANDACGKLFDLPFGFCMAISGTISHCEEVNSEMHHRMEALKNDQRSVEYIKRELFSSLQHTHLQLVQVALMQECAITLSQYWTNKKLAPALRQHAENVIGRTQLPVQAIVGGFHGDSPILLWSSALTILEEVSPGNAVIGSGGTAALYWLASRSQNASMSVSVHTCTSLRLNNLQSLRRR